jgi:hypothetical protein
MSDIIAVTGIPVPMRDGARLYADVFRPARANRSPVLLQRTPYGRAQGRATFMDPIRAVEAGYAVVIQEARGCFASDGNFAPFLYETDDGFDTVEWCAAQPWSDGKVGMYGVSYAGATQWLAAIARPPHLTAICPVMTAGDYHDGWVYQGGALRLAFVASWVAQFLAIPNLRRSGLAPDQVRAEETQIMRGLERLGRTLSYLPLKELPLLKWEGLAPYFYEWLKHPDGDAYWERWNILAHHDRIDVPALNVGGWFDLFASGPPRNFSGLQQQAAAESRRNVQRLIIGPWVHSWPPSVVAGEVNFGWEASLVGEDIALRWFDYWLREIDNGLLEEPPVRIYVMGSGWRDEDEWPLKRTEYTRFYLQSDGRANGLSGNGRLSRDDPGPDSPDLFIYNPLYPVRTLGAAGIFDQRKAEIRSDVLVYSTPPLAEPMEVTGPVVVKLYASSSALDTDFTAKLVDVAPNGFASNLSDGIVRARYRNSPTVSELLVPSQPTEFTIDLDPTSNLFRAGHRVRLDISSSNFPKFDRNPNTGEPAAEARLTQPAIQTIYHDAERPSHVILPVIPSTRN